MSSATPQQRVEAVVADTDLAPERPAKAVARKAGDFPLHGIAMNFLSRVFAKPSNEDEPIGYMRRGARFRAGPAVRGKGCASWHPVVGGYVCHDAGFQISDARALDDDAPPRPNLSDDLPYRYAYTQRDNVAKFAELPTASREQEATEIFEQMQREEEALAAAAANPSAEPDISAPPPPGTVEEEDEDDGLPDFLSERMRTGFYVSLDRVETSVIGRDFWRTIHGDFVRADALRMNDPPRELGVRLGGRFELPVAFVFRKGAHQYARNPVSGNLRKVGEFDRQTVLSIARDDFMFEERRYVITKEGVAVREPSVHIIEKHERPPTVPAGARWIHVNLTTQSLVAYEGDEPVFTTIVSTGKEGFETPTGIFRVQSKHVSATMDDAMSPEGAYSIEDVPWTMYFQGNYALHGAFWHSGFGAVRSHGCVNMAPGDARWLFQWSTPSLPPSWHAAFASRVDPGTWVFIEP